MIPDLAVPKAPPLPVVVSPPSSRGGSAEAAAGAVDPKGATSLGYATPEAPSLFPPAPPTPRAAPAAARPAPPPSAPRAAPSQPKVPARTAPETMAGVMLSAGPSTSKPKPTVASGMYVERPAREVADLRPLIGLAVVGLVTILGTGLLMQVAHRPEGWAIGRFLLGSGPGILALHLGLALVAVVLGGSRFWHGIRHWRGDASGGPPSAIVNAVIAAGAFFAAIELISSIS
jgi:hypothetical protein